MKQSIDPIRIPNAKIYYVGIQCICNKIKSVRIILACLHTCWRNGKYFSVNILFKMSIDYNFENNIILKYLEFSGLAEESMGRMVPYFPNKRHDQGCMGIETQ